jgi:hypothetical protein
LHFSKPLGKGKVIKKISNYSFSLRFAHLHDEGTGNQKKRGRALSKMN